MPATLPPPPPVPTGPNDGSGVFTVCIDRVPVFTEHAASAAEAVSRVGDVLLDAHGATLGGLRPFVHGPTASAHVAATTPDGRFVWLVEAVEVV